MRSSPRASILSVGAATVGLAASIGSFYDHVGPEPAFCAEGGCATVRASAWAAPLGIPMPILGIAFFTAAIVLAFVEAPRLRKLLAVGGAAWALLLIGLQAFVIGAWCKLCMIADPAAILYAIAIFTGASTLRFSWWKPVAIAPAAAAVVGVLALWTHTPPPPPLPPGTPAFVVDAQEPGTVTIVEVVDFECPYCRMMQAKVHEAIVKSGVKARVVRHNMPLPRHAHALPAALAYCCAERQGKGDAMAELLFTAPEETLTAEGCEELAVKAGCDREQYRRDLPLAVGRVAVESIQARASGVTSLPTVFIGGEQLVGAAASTDDLVAAIHRAKH
ncbi:MAG: thioredoxin domain-containing protein [Deltaproteobacteria bacterium]|nr:thioredoxin domain-containing protein [Deltaproteobacteria bacterium]